MPAEDVDLRVRATGAREAGRDVQTLPTALKQTETATTRVGSASRTTSGHVGLLSRGLGGLSRAARNAMLGLGGLAVAYGGVRAVRSAIEGTTQLAQTTLTLHNATGLNIQQSSRWAAVANVTGVQTTQLGMLFRTLQSQATKQVESTGKSITTFDRLGISAATVKAHMNDMPGLLQMVVTNLDKNVPAGQRAMVMQSLFGRGWQTLNPLIRDGGKNLSTYLGEAGKYVDLTGNTTQKLDELHQAQIRQKLATLGLKVAFTEAATPALIDFENHFAAIMGDIRTGDWKDMDRQITQIGTRLGQISQKVIPIVTQAMGSAGPAILEAMWKGFLAAPTGGQVFLGFALLTKLGITSGLGRYGGELIGKGIGSAFGGLSSLIGPQLKRAWAWIIGSAAVTGAEAGTAEGTALAGTQGLASAGVKTKMAATWTEMRVYQVGAATATGAEMGTAQGEAMMGTSGLASGAMMGKAALVGGLLGKAMGVALAAYIIVDAPNILDQLAGALGLKPSSPFRREAKRGWKDVIPGQEEPAGPKTPREAHDPQSSFSHAPSRAMSGQAWDPHLQGWRGYRFGDPHVRWDPTNQRHVFRQFGGPIPGYGGGDGYQLHAEGGEYMMRKEAVRKHGVRLMDMLNSGAAPAGPAAPAGDIVIPVTLMADGLVLAKVVARATQQAASVR